MIDAAEGAPCAFCCTVHNDAVLIPAKLPQVPGTERPAPAGGSELGDGASLAREIAYSEKRGRGAAAHYVYGSDGLAYATGSITSRFLDFAPAPVLPLVADAATLCLNSVPALKWGAYFAGTATFTPVLGLRPILGGR